MLQQTPTHLSIGQPSQPTKDKNVQVLNNKTKYGEKEKDQRPFFKKCNVKFILAYKYLIMFISHYKFFFQNDHEFLLFYQLKFTGYPIPRWYQSQLPWIIVGLLIFFNFHFQKGQQVQCCEHSTRLSFPLSFCQPQPFYHQEPI